MTKSLPIKILPSQDYLLRHLSYDPQTGELRWKIQGRGRRLDHLAGRLRSTGYRYVEIDHRIYLAHRIIWKLMTGDDPKEIIDHKDNDPTNNRWSNLREATKADNQRNTKNYVTNRSGVKGVSWHSPTGKWRAKISVNSRTIHIGLFDNLSDAARARDLAAERLHGAFARRE